MNGRLTVRFRTLVSGALLFAFILPISGVLAQDKIDSNLFAGLRWRNVGPFRAGRVNGVSGVPGQLSTYYFCSVGGGAWKTMNSGRTWQTIFDSQGIASIGAIGVAPSNVGIDYVGT